MALIVKHQLRENLSNGDCGGRKHFSLRVQVYSSSHTHPKTQQKHLINIINAPKVFWGHETTSSSVCVYITAHLVQVCEFLFVSFTAISQAYYTDGLHFLILKIYFSFVFLPLMVFCFCHSLSMTTPSHRHGNIIHCVASKDQPGCCSKSLSVFYISGKG